MYEMIKDGLDIIAIPITTLVLGLLLPYRWQKRERDTKIKTELVTEITNLFMETAMTVYMYKIRCRHRSEVDTTQKSDLAQIYHQWKVKSCVIGSKLHAYYPIPTFKNPVTDQKGHGNGVRLRKRSFYTPCLTGNARIGTRAENCREKLLHKRWDCFAKLVADFYWECWKTEGEIKKIEKLDKLAEVHRVDKDNNLEKYKETLFSIKAEIIQAILVSEITGFADRKDLLVIDIGKFRN